MKALANSEGSGKTARMRRRLAVRICEKYHYLMCWHIYIWDSVYSNQLVPWFEPRSGGQILLMDGQVFFFFSGFSGFRPPLMNDGLDISEIFLGRKTRIKINK